MKDISIYQWDKDLTIDSDSPVLFCAKGDKDGLVVAPKGGKVSIPNQLTAKGKDIAAYAMDGAHVKDSCWIRVTAVAKPSNYVFTETEVDSVESFKDFAVAAIKAAQDEYKGVADDAKKALSEIQTQVKLIEAAEESRKQAESARVTAEQERETTFGSWTLEESKRSKREQSRAAAEAKRESDTKAAINNLNSEITKANSKVDSAVNGANAKVEALVSSTNTKTDAQIALAKEATDKANASAAKADTATGKANEATIAATNAATKANEVEAKLTGNILKGKTKDTFIHVDDAFPSTLLGLEIEGATEQVTTTGKNLLDCYKLAEIASEYYVVENGNLKVIKSYNEAWSNVPVFITLDAGTYYSSGDKTLEIRKASDNSTLLFGEGKFTLDQTTEIKIKVGTGLSSYPVVVKAQIEKGSTATAYEPYTGGKPSPSPDFPQEIKVVENPTIKILGKNLMSVGIDEAGNSADNFYMSPQIDRLTFSFYAEKDWWTGNPNGPRIFVHEYYPSNGTYSAQAVGVLEFSKETGKRVKATIPFKSKLTDKYAGYICTRGYHGGIYTNCHDFMFSFGDADEAYSDYRSAEQVITLPAEHPYLAKIGNVVDEVKVDKDGNVSLVANVGHMTLAEFASSTILNMDKYADATDASVVSGFRINSSEMPRNRAAICSILPYLKGSWDKRAVCIEWLDGLLVWLSKSTLGITTDDNYAVRADKLKAYAADKNDVHIYYALGDDTKKTYPLGKINLPVLPDSISNVWTDAEITPHTTIEYAKDVNIAYDKLANAIVASVGGEANVS